MKQSKKNKQQYWQFVGWSLTVSVFISLIIPLIRQVNNGLLMAGQIPAVSVISTQRLVSQHPGISLLSIVWALGLTLLDELILVVWLIASHLIFTANFSWKRLASQLRQLGCKKFWQYWPVAMVNIIAALPVISLAFRTPLTIISRVIVMILDYGVRLPWLPIVVLLAYLVCLYLSFRWISVFWFINDMPSRQAYRQSWQKTRGRDGWRIFRQVLKPLLISAAVSWLINGVILLVQAICDHWAWQPRWLLSLGLWIMMVAASLCLLNWLASLINLPLAGQGQASTSDFSTLFLIGTLCWLGLAGGISWQSFPVLKHTPVLIAHRGVADKDGVQNTLPAMKRTYRKDHPDYVEIDVHETRDGRFVVLHDENLQKLTGVNRRPRQLKLAKIIRLKARENGYRAHMDSFDQYLSTANAMHQRLLVELKTTEADSPAAWQRFVDLYGRNLGDHGHLIQSMDAGVLRELHRQAPYLHSFYIQAYNVGGPDRNMSAFNIEYSGLNRAFIRQAHDQHQLVYVWTVNNPTVAKELFFQQADGIVTDRLDLMRSALKEAQRNSQGWQRLWYVINPAPNWDSWQDRP